MKLFKRAFRPISPGSLLERMRHARSASLRVSGPWQAIILAMGILSAAQALHADSRQTITEDRLKGASWWPTKGSYARSEYAGPEACEGCHASHAETWKTTPMARAGFESREPEVLQRPGKLEFKRNPFTYRIEKAGGTSTYTVTDGAKEFPLPLQWVMGLGVIAQTFVYEFRGIYYESRVSHYTAVDRLDVTPGQENAFHSSGLEDAHGRVLYGNEAERCFACHTTAAVVENRLEPAGLDAGVTCEGCHGPGAGHIAAVQSGKSIQGTVFNPRGLGASESVDFCGACHRTWWDVMLLDIHGPLNVRFQPYRLQGSRCWNPDDSRISCVTCHDPHMPLEKRAAAYDEKCLACHVSRGTDAVSKERPGRACPVGTQDCSTCHMPRTEIKGMYAHFSDHRIRVVRPGEAYPD